MSFKQLQFISIITKKSYEKNTKNYWFVFSKNIFRNVRFVDALITWTFFEITIFQAIVAEYSTLHTTMAFRKILDRKEQFEPAGDGLKTVETTETVGKKTSRLNVDTSGQWGSYKTHFTQPNNTTYHNTITTQHSTTQHNATQQNKAKQNKTQHNTTQQTQHNTTQHNTTTHCVEHNTTQQHNTRQDKTTQHKTRQNRTRQHKTTQDNTRQHNNTTTQQHDTTQHNTIQLNATQRNTTT